MPLNDELMGTVLVPQGGGVGKGSSPLTPTTPTATPLVPFSYSGTEQSDSAYLPGSDKIGAFTLV